MELLLRGSAACCSHSPVLDTRRRSFSGNGLCPISRFPRAPAFHQAPVSFPSGHGWSEQPWTSAPGPSTGPSCPQAGPRRLSGGFPPHPATAAQDGVEEGLRSGGASAHAFFSQERFRRVVLFMEVAKSKFWRQVAIPGWILLQEVFTTVLGAIDLLRYALLSQAGVELAVAVRWCRRLWLWFLMVRRRRKVSVPRVAPSEASPTLSLLRCLLDDSHSHEAKLAKIKAASELQDLACRATASSLMLSAGVSAAAVSCLMAEASRKGLEPEQVERVARRLIESTEDTELALQRAFAAIFMAEPSASLKPSQ